MRRPRGGGPRRPGPALIGDLGAAMARALVTVGLALSLLAGTSASPAGAGTVPPMAGLISRVPDVTSSAGGLSLTLSVSPGRAAPGAAVEFTLTVAARAANGALGYGVRFGDGSSHANAIPMYCLAGPGRPEHGTWRLVHRYARPGTYHVSVTGYANCGPDRADVTHNVVIT